jgi:hypothetical protein
MREVYTSGQRPAVLETCRIEDLQKKFRKSGEEKIFRLGRRIYDSRPRKPTVPVFFESARYRLCAIAANRRAVSAIGKPTQTM